MDRLDLLFPEWQGYGAHQEVYYGAHHFCRHLRAQDRFSEVAVSPSETLEEEGGVLGRSSLLKLLDSASSLISIADPEHIFMLGGTCACEIAPVAFLNQKYDNDLAVFWFDAHGDLNTPETSPSKRLHGMPLRSLLGEGDHFVLERIKRFLNPEQVALVGARDLDKGELTYIDQHKVPVFRPQNLSHTHELIDFVRSRGFKHAYIHFDLDVLEPNEFKHVLVATPEGVSIAHAIDSLRLIREHLKVVGCSIVEYCPKDESGDHQLQTILSQGMGIRF